MGCSCCAARAIPGTIIIQRVKSDTARNAKCLPVQSTLFKIPYQALRLRLAPTTLLINSSRIAHALTSTCNQIREKSGFARMDTFDNLSHDWLLKFVQHRVADRRILRLIQKWLKAGVVEEGQWENTEMGSPQGSVASPLLANIYLHYVFDLWVEAWRRKYAQGDVIVVRYADDNVLRFQHRTDADCFLAALQERLQRFGLELHPEKTRRIEFGRFAEQDRKRRGEGKPETFDFLGFTHISGKDRNGDFAVKRKTVRKRMRAKLLELKQQLCHRMHDPIALTGKWLRSIVQGYFNYHAVPGNTDNLHTFRNRVVRLWRTILIHRSQRHHLNWARMQRLADQWLPKPRVLHPYSRVRFDAIHPR